MGFFFLSGWQFLSLKRDSGGHATTKNLPGLMKKLRGLNEVISEEEIAAHLSQSYPDADQEIEFESFLREYLNLQSRVSAKEGGGGGGGGGKTASSFLKSSTTTLLHNLNQAEKSSYVAHINTYLREDPFLKKYLPIEPTDNQLFDLVRDGVLLW
jgi:plastin-1